MNSVMGVRLFFQPGGSLAWEAPLLRLFSRDFSSLVFGIGAVSMACSGECIFAYLSSPGVLTGHKYLEVASVVMLNKRVL